MKLRTTSDIITEHKWFIIHLFVLVIVQAVWILNSDGFYFIDDSCHYNYNRHFFTKFYSDTFGAWSRLGRVIIFILPSLLGLKAVQIFSSLIFVFTLFFSYKILLHFRIRYAYWIVLFAGFQPVLFNISYTVLAELPAAFLIILGYYFFIKGKKASALIVSSLVFLFRTEYYYVSGIFVISYLFNRDYKIIPLVLFGPLLWFLHSFFVSLNPMQFFYDLGLHSRLPRVSEGIDWNYYLLRFPQIYGILQTVFFAAALIFIPFRRETKKYGILLLIIFGGVVFHTLAALKGLNVSCSVGQLRYVAVVGPVFAIVSVFGLDRIINIIGSNYIKVILAVLLITGLFISGPFLTPFHVKLQLESESEKIAELVEKQYKGYKVLSSLHFIANALDEPKTGGEVFKELTRANLEKYDKSLIVFLKELENDPFVGETTKLNIIESMPNIKLLYTQKKKVNRNGDVPVFRYYYDDAPEFIKDIIKYMTNDQFTWEDFEMKVYVKE